VTRALDDLSLTASLLLSVQRALLGEVPPALRGVTVAWHDQVILIRSYFDGPITDGDREAMSCATSEVIADFPAPWTIEDDVVRCDAPEPLECLAAWAYHRQEPSVRRLDTPEDGAYYSPPEFSEVERLMVRRPCDIAGNGPLEILEIDLRPRAGQADHRRLYLQFLNVRGLRFLSNGSPPSQLHSLEIQLIQDQQWEGCNYRVIDVEEEGLSFWCLDYTATMTVG
jgi:hypothetical protein